MPRIKIESYTENGKRIRCWNWITLADLIGTPKQITWANSIQESMLNTIYEDQTDRGEIEMTTVIKNKIAHVTDCKWFINNNNTRNSFPGIARSLGVNKPRYYPMPDGAYVKVPIPESLHPEIAAIFNKYKVPDLTILDNGDLLHSKEMLALVERHMNGTGFHVTPGGANANINGPTIKIPAETRNAVVAPLPENKDLIEQDQIARYAAIELT